MEKSEQCWAITFTGSTKFQANVTKLTRSLPLISPFGLTFGQSVSAGPPTLTVPIWSHSLCGECDEIVTFGYFRATAY